MTTTEYSALLIVFPRGTKGWVFEIHLVQIENVGILGKLHVRFIRVHNHCWLVKGWERGEVVTDPASFKAEQQRAYNIQPPLFDLFPHKSNLSFPSAFSSVQGERTTYSKSSTARRSHQELINRIQRRSRRISIRYRRHYPT